MQATPARPFRLLGASALALGGLTLLFLAVASSGNAATLDNGALGLGFNADGTLISPETAPSGTDPAAKMGLRLDSGAVESLGSGCGCEGWGIAHDGVSAHAKSGSLAVGLAPVSFAATGTSATSVLDGAGLRITHAAHASASLQAWAIDVTIQNPGTTPAAGILYRRVADWNIEPTPGAEMVSLHAASPTPAWLAFSSDDGLAPADPLAGPSQILVQGPPGAPEAPAAGPADHGTLLDLSLGCLGPGDAVQFTLLYGVASTPAAAAAVLGALGSQAWSLAQASGGSAGPVFFLGVAGLDGPGCLPTAFTAVFTTTAPSDLTLDPVKFTDLTAPGTLLGLETSRSWSFGDTATDPGASPTHAYAKSGSYNACLHVGAHVVASPAPWRAWTGCAPVAVHNRLPATAFTYTVTGVGTLKFNDATTDADGTVVTRAWDFGDGKKGVGTAPEHGFDDAGSYSVCLVATDDQGGAKPACQAVAAPAQSNRPPIMMSVRARHVAAGALVQFSVLAFDPEGDAVTYAADHLPAGSSFDAGTRQFAWQTQADQVGVHDDIHFTATDTHGATAERFLVIRIGAVALDADLDGVADDADLCPGVFDPLQADADADGLGDLCDPSTATPDEVRASVLGPAAAPPAVPPVCGAGAADAGAAFHLDRCGADMDGDGIPDRGPDGAFLDNCPLQPNADQADADGDGFGDVCALPAGALQQAAPNRMEAGALADGTQPASAQAPSPVAGHPSHAWILLPFAGGGILAGLAGIALLALAGPRKR